MFVFPPVNPRLDIIQAAGQPIPAEFTEVTEIAFGEQPETLFEPPEGLARMSAEEYTTYICARDLPNEMAPGVAKLFRARTMIRR